MASNGDKVSRLVLTPVPALATHTFSVGPLRPWLGSEGVWIDTESQTVA